MTPCPLLNKSHDNAIREDGIICSISEANPQIKPALGSNSEAKVTASMQCEVKKFREDLRQKWLDKEV